MAGDNEPPKGFTKVESSGGDDNQNIETVDLEPGDVLQGTVTDVNSGEDENGPYHRLRVMDEERGLVDYWAKWDAKTACNEERIEEGVDVYIAVDEEPTTFTPNGSDEEQSKHKHQCWVDDGSDGGSS